MKVVPISAVVRTPEIVPNNRLAQLPGTELFKKNKYRQHLLKFIQDTTLNATHVVHSRNCKQ